MIKLEVGKIYKSKKHGRMLYAGELEHAYVFCNLGRHNKPRLNNLFRWKHGFNRDDEFSEVTSET